MFKDTIVADFCVNMKTYMQILHYIASSYVALVLIPLTTLDGLSWHPKQNLFPRYPKIAISSLKTNASIDLHYIFDHIQIEPLKKQTNKQK